MSPIVKTDSVEIQSIQLQSLQDSSRIVIKLTSPAPHYLLHSKGNPEAFVELPGVSSGSFRPEADYVDSFVSGIWVEEPAPMTASIRIVLNEASSSIEAFGSSQLPGIVIDIRPVGPKTPKPPLPGISPEGGSESRPGYSTERDGAFGDPKDFPSQWDFFPLETIRPVSEAGKALLALFRERKYHDVYSGAWEFFEQQAGSGDRTDELVVLALAAEARYQDAMKKDEDIFDNPLNYYRQLWRRAPEGSIKAFASYRIGQCQVRLRAELLAYNAFRQAVESRGLPFTDRIYRLMGDLYIPVQSLDKAQQFYLDMAEIDSGSPLCARLLVRIGNLLVGSGRWDEASKIYQAALGIDPDVESSEHTLRYYLGRISEAKGEIEQAGANYDLFLRRGFVQGVGAMAYREMQLHASKFVVRQSYLAGYAKKKTVFIALENLVRLSENEEAKDLARRARFELALTGMIHWAHDRVQTSFLDVDLYAAPAPALLEDFNGDIDPEVALEAALELLRLPSENLDESGGKILTDCISAALSQAAREGGSLEGSHPLFVGEGLARALRADYDAGRFLDGARLFRMSKRYVPTVRFPELCSYYGALCYFEIRAPEESLILLEELAEFGDSDLIPPDAIAFHMAEAEAARDRILGFPQDDARRRLMDLMREYPETPLFSRVQLLLGRCLACDGELTVATQALQQALDSPGLVDEEQIQAYLELGEAFASLGRRDRAVESLIRGIFLFESKREPFPDSAVARHLLWTLSENLFLAQEWNRAAVSFEQCLEFYPDDEFADSARFFLATCRKNAGDYAEATVLFADLAADKTARDYLRDLAGEEQREIVMREVGKRIGLELATATAKGNGKP